MPWEDDEFLDRTDSRVTCPQCLGNGSLYTYAYPRICSRCQGVGTVRVDDAYDLPANDADEARAAYADGIGQVP